MIDDDKSSEFNRLSRSEPLTSSRIVLAFRVSGVK